VLITDAPRISGNRAVTSRVSVLGLVTAAICVRARKGERVRSRDGGSDSTEIARRRLELALASVVSDSRNQPGRALLCLRLILAFATVKAARVRGSAYRLRSSDTVKPAAA